LSGSFSVSKSAKLYNLNAAVPTYQTGSNWQQMFNETPY